MERYSKILIKKKREIVLLRGSGCIYKQCSFCDYFLDQSNNLEENYLLNKIVLENVSGEFHELEVINSGSVFELDIKTLTLIKHICKTKNIYTLHFEAHYLYKNRLNEIRIFFDNVQVKFKLGLETFDYNLRENVLKKGIKETNPKVISNAFQEANFLFGITGQNYESMKKDILLGLQLFDRICINIMCPNSTKITPNKEVIQIFMNELYPLYKDHPCIDILIDNKDFGVGD